MLLPSEIRKIRDERDITDTPRDILEFNYKQLAEGALEYIEANQKRHDEDMAQLRRIIDLGTYVYALMSKAQRAGKKTVRIAEVFEEAQRRADGN